MHDPTRPPSRETPDAAGNSARGVPRPGQVGDGPVASTGASSDAPTGAPSDAPTGTLAGIDRADWYQKTSAASIGIEIAVAICLGTFGGRWIEQHWTHWSPWTTVIGFLVGVGAAGLAIWRVVLEHNADVAARAAARTARASAPSPTEAGPHRSGSPDVRATATGENEPPSRDVPSPVSVRASTLDGRDLPPTRRGDDPLDGTPDVPNSPDDERGPS